jgi:N-methylhydantoinase A
MPHLEISISSEIVPLYQEFERFSTTVLNAYLQKRVKSYIHHLERGIRSAGARTDVTVMTSGGGSVNAGQARLRPVDLLFSGPAAGAIGATFVAKQAGYSDLITYDMGGTSTDVCLIKDSTLPMSAERSIGGFPNRTLQIQINSIGAGGGSIAWVDEGPVLRVGPKSAGARPGPAAYGLGGIEPTVTDANLLLHRLDPSSKLAGEISLDSRLAAGAIARVTAHYPRMDQMAAAEGIISVAVAKMVSAIKEISIARGHDPRDFALFAFGGAGPLHATLVATELEMPTVVVPLAPGNLSALGLLIADLRHNYSVTRIMRLPEADISSLETVFADLEKKARRQLVDVDGVPKEAVELSYSLGMRYVGQWHEIDVPVEVPLPPVKAIETRFHSLYEQGYAHCEPGAPTEVVTFRVGAIGRLPKPRLRPTPERSESLTDALKENRDVYLGGRFQPVPVYRRELMPSGISLQGPAIIEELGATTFITSEYGAHVDELGNVILKRT